MCGADFRPGAKPCPTRGWDFRPGAKPCPMHGADFRSRAKACQMRGAHFRPVATNVFEAPDHGPSLLPSDKSDGNSNQMGGFKLFDDALQFVEETVAGLFAGLADEIRLGHEHFLKLTNAFTKLGIGGR